MKLFIIHPGIQHAPRLANGAVRSGLFDQVTLFTSVLFKTNRWLIGPLKKRTKPIDGEVKIINHYLYMLLYSLTKFLYNKIIVKPKTQSHNNPIYFWQQVFGYLCLPRIYINRKNLLLVCFETTGWPIVKYCKKWNIPVIMDFASISHEKAKTLGINETQYGINLKVKERALIDYGFYCSDFCRKSFEGFTSSKKDFVLYLGAEGKKIQKSDIKHQDDKYHPTESGHHKIKVSFIANLEYRKGLDIFLESIYGYEYPVFLEVHLIGKIRPEWVNSHMPTPIKNTAVQLHYQPAMSQKELFLYLQEHQFDLNVQCSRFDSFAMVVPETMMQGIPNIVSPFVGAGETLTNNVDGYVMKELSAKCLTSKIKDYIDLSTNNKLNLKNNVLNSSLKMDWQNYYNNLAESLQLILKNLGR